jgi:hypothetical protein
MKVKYQKVHDNLFERSKPRKNMLILLSYYSCTQGIDIKASEEIAAVLNPRVRQKRKCSHVGIV